MSLAPGSILQRMHLRSRVRQASNRSRTFIEIGAGEGGLSQLLLEEGLTGCGYDLNSEACARNHHKNGEAVRSGRYAIHLADFFDHQPATADVVVCSMVIEHLPNAQVDLLFRRVASFLRPEGIFCVFVPASPAHWGIEDDIAGHLRRYRLTDFQQLADSAGMIIRDLRGLTYPISNLLLPISNILVRRAESHKIKLSASQRTVDSGARNVAFKTTFPKWIGMLLNEVTLYPFYLWQKMAAQNPSSLVIYCEMSTSPASDSTSS